MNIDQASGRLYDAIKVCTGKDEYLPAIQALKQVEDLADVSNTALSLLKLHFEGTFDQQLHGTNQLSVIRKLEALLAP